ncbi:MAG: zinc finger domain-containing protein, partial [Candidatus Helarchaeota archaeon]
MAESELIKTPICTCCNRIISPNEDAIKFVCPECGDIIIWRCEMCRKFSRPYR